MGARVRWGQCFLVDGDAARRIVEWAGIDGQPVVEIGPGRGALTGFLRERASSLVLVEIDPELAASLEEQYRGDPRVRVVQGDALAVDWRSGLPDGYSVVSNLPYESGTAILSSLLARREGLRSIVVMLQREVVERLAAVPGSKVYGALSVLVQAVADVERGMVVAPRSFRPRPAVESRMVRLRPLSVPRAPFADHEEFARVVHAAFGQRRKMLRNNLGRHVAARFGEDALVRVLEGAGLRGDVRPEELSVADFAALTREVVRLRDAQADEARPVADVAANVTAATTRQDADATTTGDVAAATMREEGAATRAPAAVRKDAGHA